MQLGSGTFDLKPALTYSRLSSESLWNWGGQAMAILRLGQNSNDYSLGDSLKLNTWLQRALGSAATRLRFAYSNTGSIHGHDPAIQKAIDDRNGMNMQLSYMAPTMPDADPNNYGGQRLDGFVGVSIPMGIFSLGVEGGVPLCQNLNGLQMKNDWYRTAGAQAMFLAASVGDGKRMVRLGELLLVVGRQLGVGRAVPDDLGAIKANMVCRR